MALTDYSTTPASNSLPPPNGAPEGMAAADVNNVQRQVMADIKAGVGVVVNTTALMTALDVAKLSDNNVICVTNYSADGDGGGGNFFYDSASAATANGGTIFAPDSGSGRFIRLVGNSLNFRWFGADFTGATDATTPVKNCMAAAAGKTIVGVKGDSFLVGPVDFTVDLHIDGNGITFLGSGDSILNQRANNSFTVLDRVTFNNSVAPTGDIGKEAFNMREYGVEPITAFPTGQEYSSTLLMFKDCNFNHLKVTTSGPTTNPYFDRCTWGHAATIKVAPTFVLISTGTNDFVNPTLGGYMRDCRFLDVYPTDGSNQDIIKLTGSRSGFEISHNEIRNANTAAVAQVDVFIGNDGLIFEHNTLYNTILHRKQTGSGQPTIDTNFDVFFDNKFYTETGHTLITEFILARGSFFKIIDNSFQPGDSTTIVKCIDVDIEIANVDPIPSDESFAVHVRGNTFDLRNANTGSFACQQQPGVTAGGAMLYSGNTQFLGIKMVAVRAHSLVTDNIWIDTTNSAGVAINGTANAPGFASGNIATTEAIATIQNMRVGVNNGFDVVFTTVAGGASINASQVNFVQVNGTGNVGLTGGAIGDELKIFCSGGDPNFVQSGTLILSGSVDYTMDFNDTLTLVKMTSTKWVEFARSQD